MERNVNKKSCFSLFLSVGEDTANLPTGALVLLQRQVMLRFSDSKSHASAGVCHNKVKID
jgi:hypothetical protein